MTLIMKRLEVVKGKNGDEEKCYEASKCMDRIIGLPLSNGKEVRE